MGVQTSLHATLLISEEKLDIFFYYVTYLYLHKYLEERPGSTGLPTSLWQGKHDMLVKNASTMNKCKSMVQMQCLLITSFKFQQTRVTIHNNQTLEWEICGNFFKILSLTYITKNCPIVQKKKKKLRIVQQSVPESWSWIQIIDIPPRPLTVLLYAFVSNQSKVFKLFGYSV